jgi:hypothetical protein
MLSYARERGYSRFSAFARRDGAEIQIVFNDAHRAPQIRVNVMEELFHIRLGHRPGILSIVPRNGNCRTSNAHNETEAYGCATAALVPFVALEAMLTRQTHIGKIAEHFELRKAYDQGVFCLSSRYDSPLMWSHYADQHRGICVEFDVSKLPAGTIRGVRYGDSREVRASAIQSWLRDDNVGARQEIESACLLTKSTDWKYEEEYRLLGSVGVQISVMTFKSITFALKCERPLEHAVIAALGGDASGLDFFRIRSPGSIELSREEIDIQETLAGMPRINILDELEPINTETDTGGGSNQERT